MAKATAADPAYGKRLLPNIIDDIAKTEPERPFAKIPDGTDGGGKHIHRTVTYVQLAAAVNKMAWWLRETLGEASGFPTTAYFGPQDLIYPLLCLGGSKVGWKIFFPSPRNDLKAHLSLLEAYQCRKIMLPTGPVFRGMFSAVIQASKMECLDMPAVDFFLDASEVSSYPWKTSFEQGRLEPLVTSQTSGSTGIPKPVVVCQGTVSSSDAYQRVSDLVLFTSPWIDRNVICAFPFFHSAGIVMLFNAVVYRYITILPPPGPLHAQMIASLVKEHDITVGILPPSLIVDLATDASLSNTFKQLEYVMYGGGPLPTDVGDKVNKMTRLTTAFGGTEFGFLPTIPNDDQEDWLYLNFPKQSGICMRPYTDELSEMVFVRDPALEDFQTVFMTFPDLQEYATKDLFAPHPTKLDLWRFCGRSDDIVVYSTGNKFNPSRMEDTLNGHPAVKSALMCGTARFQSAILIEPVQYPSGSRSTETLIDSVWPLIEKVNIDSPGYARVTKNMILITTAEKPFPRASKGTVQRRMAMDMYSTEIDRLYAAAESEEALTTNGDAISNDFTASILDAVHRIAGLEHITATDRLFDSGMDSLGAVTLVRALRRLVHKHGLKSVVTAGDVYRCGTVRELAASLVNAIEQAPSASETMQALYERYTRDLPVTARAPSSRPAKSVILLTGSTGSLGCYLLNAVLQDDGVNRVICLNRTADAEVRQAVSMEEKGLSTDFKLKSVLFLQADMSKEYLGVGIQPYQQLLGEVTHVLHNAWLVNFNNSLEDFAATHINGVRQLVDFSARSRYAASIIFISSIGAVQRWTGSQKVPETIIQDWTAAGSAGYAESKLVSERILAKAATDAGVPSVICRLGQIAGPTLQKGIWPSQEWLPSLLYSSRYLGCLPDSLGPLDVVDWVPVELMADVVLEFLHTFDESTSPTVYHAVNPSKTTWTQLAPFLAKRLGVSTVPAAEWVGKLSTSDPDAVVVNPAVKLIEFFRGIAGSSDGELRQAELDTAQSCTASPTLSKTSPVNEEWLDNWLQQWGLAPTSAI